MQLRRAALPLPLMLAALALTAGCVTVRPPGPAEPGRPAPTVDRAVARETAVEALPLGRLPTAEPPTTPPQAAPEAGSPRPGTAQAEENRPRRRTGSGGPAHGPAHPARPAPAPKPRKRPPARPKPRPALPRTYDMASLCEAAEGTVSPSIVALCH